MYNMYPNPASDTDTLPFSSDVLDNRIHHIIFNVPSQAVIAEWLRYLEHIFQQGANRPVLTLTDARRSVMPPLAYVTHLSQMLTCGHMLRIRSKNAILHREAPLDAEAQSIVQALLKHSGHRIRFFHADEKSAATRWLLTDD